MVAGDEKDLKVMEKKAGFQAEVVLMVEQALMVGAFLCERATTKGDDILVWDDGRQLIRLSESVNAGRRFMKMEVSNQGRVTRLFVPFGAAGLSLYRVGVMIKSFSKLFPSGVRSSEGPPATLASSEERPVVAGEEDRAKVWTLGSISNLWTVVCEVFNGDRRWWKVDKTREGVVCIVVYSRRNGEDDRVTSTADHFHSDDLGHPVETLDPPVEPASDGSQNSFDDTCKEVLATAAENLDNMEQKRDVWAEEFDFQTQLGSYKDGRDTRGGLVEHSQTRDQEAIFLKLWVSRSLILNLIFKMDLDRCEESETCGLFVDDCGTLVVDKMVYGVDSQPLVCYEMDCGHLEVNAGMGVLPSTCGDALGNGPMSGPFRKLGFDRGVPCVVLEAFSGSVEPSPLSSILSATNQLRPECPARSESAQNLADWVGSFHGFFNESYPDPGHPIPESTEPADLDLFTSFCMFAGQVSTISDPSLFCLSPQKHLEHGGNDGLIGKLDDRDEPMFTGKNRDIPRLHSGPKKRRIRKGWARPKPGFSDLLASARLIEAQRIKAKTTHKLRMISPVPYSSHSIEVASPTSSEDKEVQPSSVWVDFCSDGFL